MKHRVDSAVYVTYGAMSPQLAEKTGFSDKDDEIIRCLDELSKIKDGKKILIDIYQGTIANFKKLLS